MPCLETKIGSKNSTKRYRSFSTTELHKKIQFLFALKIVLADADVLAHRDGTPTRQDFRVSSDDYRIARAGPGC